MAARARPPVVRDLDEETAAAESESGGPTAALLQERLAALSLRGPSPQQEQQQQEEATKEAEGDDDSSALSSDESESDSGSDSGSSTSTGSGGSMVHKRSKPRVKKPKSKDGGSKGSRSPVPKAKWRRAKAMKKQRRQQQEGAKSPQQHAAGSAVASPPPASPMGASGGGSPASGGRRRRPWWHRRRSGKKGQQEAAAGAASSVVVVKESVEVTAAAAAAAAGAAALTVDAPVAGPDAGSNGGSAATEQGEGEEEEEEGGGGSGCSPSSVSGGGKTTKKKKKKKAKRKPKAKAPKPLPGLVATLEGLRAGLASGVLEVHVPTCACKAADWRRGMEADGVVGFVAATVSLTSHAKPLAALVGDPDPAHTLEGEQRTMTLLHAAALGHAQVKAAKCARLTVEPTLGAPSFLHGAAMIVGERSHLEALARVYGFRPQAQRRAEDEACCLLVAPLPSSGMYGYGGTPGAASKASMRAQAVAGRFLELLAAAHARGPGKREPNRVEHHLRTALCALTREGVLRALGHGTMLAEPAILAMGQEWPERYTVDAFGGKRELGESSLEAAVRETREESGGALRLDDARCFARLPALDMRDNAMAFFGFLFREHLGTNVRPSYNTNPYATRSQTQRWGGGLGVGFAGSAPFPSMGTPSGRGGSARGGRGGRGGGGGRGGRGQFG